MLSITAHTQMKKGILASMKLEETAGRRSTYQVGILYPDPLLVTVTLKTAIEVAIGIFEGEPNLICPMQLKVAGL